MKCKIHALLIGCTGFFSLFTGTISAAGVESLRGGHAIDDQSNRAVIQRWQDDNEPIQRAYIQQPPLIPHTIERYTVNLKVNKCLTCHSWANYRESGATKISQTHFENREGESLSNISARRYFCVQCHVPQINASPLVRNEFQSVQGISGR